MPRVTALYAGLMVVLFLGLTLRVFAARFRSGVTLGTGDDRRLLRAARVHANFAENVPLFLAALLAEDERERLAALQARLQRALTEAAQQQAAGKGQQGDARQNQAEPARRDVQGGSGEDDWFR